MDFKKGDISEVQLDQFTEYMNWVVQAFGTPDLKVSLSKTNQNQIKVEFLEDYKIKAPGQTDTVLDVVKW